MNWSTDELTMALILLGYAVMALRYIAPKTKTTADDELLAGIEKAVEWAEQWSPAFWNIAEVAATEGRITKARKLMEFRKQMEESYRRIHDREMPAEAKAAAEMVAGGLSAAHKRDALEDGAPFVSPEAEG